MPAVNIETIHGQFKKLRRHYHKLLEHFELEEIHNFRLEMKRLRSIVRLLNTSITDAEKLKVPEALKTFYDATGHLRNIQIHQQRVARLCQDLLLDVPLFYLQLFQNAAHQQKQHLLQLAHNISFQAFEKLVVKMETHKWHKASLKEFTVQKRQIIWAIATISNYTDEDLHALRKEIKDLQNNRPYIHEFTALLIPHSFFNGPDLEALGADLGTFHDLCISLGFFAPVYLDAITVAAEKKVLCAIKPELEQEKDDLKAAIINRLRLLKQAHYLDAGHALL